MKEREKGRDRQRSFLRDLCLDKKETKRREQILIEGYRKIEEEVRKEMEPKQILPDSHFLM